MIKKQLLKKNLPDKINAAKNALLFLSRAPAHSFIFNSRFLYELKDMVGLSKTKLYLGFRIFDSVSFLLKISYSIKSLAVQKKQKRKKKKNEYKSYYSFYEKENANIYKISLQAFYLECY